MSMLLVQPICTRLYGEKTLELLVEGLFLFQYLEQNFHMLCRTLDWHEWFHLAIQTIQKMLCENITVVGSIAHIDGECFLARFVIFQVEEFYFVRVPARELKPQAAFCAVDARLIWHFRVDA